MITAEMVRQLRERTGSGMMDCKKALTDANGDMEKAIGDIEERGLAAAAKKPEGSQLRASLTHTYTATAG